MTTRLWTTSFTRIDDMLRGRRIDSAPHRAPFWHLAAIILAAGCWYGLVMGAFNGFATPRLWQMLFSDAQAYPSFVADNSAGRFAFSRTLTTGAVFDTLTPFADQFAAQEVRVLQTYNGKQLLRVATSPIQRSGQNFALSPNGLSLAVIHDPVDGRLKEVQHKPAIEIYKLPPLTDKEQHEVNAEIAFAGLEQMIPRAHQMGVHFVEMRPGYVRADLPFEGNGNHFGTIYAGVIVWGAA